jgi:hypothetical protein
VYRGGPAPLLAGAFHESHHDHRGETAFRRLPYRDAALDYRGRVPQFYGDRIGGVRDLAGNYWWIATHIEEVPPDEIKLRAERWLKERTRVER